MRIKWNGKAKMKRERKIKIAGKISFGGIFSMSARFIRSVTRALGSFRSFVCSFDSQPKREGSSPF